MRRTRVLAAGGIVLRAAGSAIETVVIHRPRYDDWSFPKGKLDPHETHEEAALREVFEETGLLCEILDPLGSVEYPLPGGGRKPTQYWIMRVREDHAFEPDDEVDEVRWVSLEEASRTVTHPLDRALARRVGIHRGVKRL